MASQAPELGSKQTGLKAALFFKIDLKVVPRICLEQTEEGLREDNLSSVDTLLFQHQILQVVKGE